MRLNILLNPIQLNEAIEDIKQHLDSLPSAIDSFLEGCILESAHYTIELDGEKTGFTAIHQEKLISQFFLRSEYKRYGQEIFKAIKGLGKVQAAFVATCDEFFLSHALDEFQDLRKQAYFFAAPSGFSDTSELPYTLRQATESDISYLVSAHIFGDQSTVQSKVANQELFITLSVEDIVGFGIIEKSKLLEGKASIGMFVSEDHRQKGVGTATLKLLMTECQKHNLSPIAGCAYSNQVSKKTLERAGMFTQTRLLKIEF